MDVFTQYHGPRFHLQMTKPHILHQSVITRTAIYFSKFSIYKTLHNIEFAVKYSWTCTLQNLNDLKKI